MLPGFASSFAEHSPFFLVSSLHLCYMHVYCINHTCIFGMVLAVYICHNKRSCNVARLTIGKCHMAQAGLQGKWVNLC